MNQPAKAQEPTMEEILASIRRIIADDDSGKAPASAADPVPPPPAPSRPEPVVPPAPGTIPASPAMQQIGLEETPSHHDAAPQPAATLAEHEADVLELTESMAAVPPPSLANGGFRTIDGQSDVVFEQRPPESEPAPTLDRERATLHEPLVSAATSAAMDSAFNTLAHTVLVHNARTLEDLVREMLRPLLKTWLDDNLPGLVERLVRAEIERVSRGRG